MLSREVDRQRGFMPPGPLLVTEEPADKCVPSPSRLSIVANGELRLNSPRSTSASSSLLAPHSSHGSGPSSPKTGTPTRFEDPLLSMPSFRKTSMPPTFDPAAVVGSPRPQSPILSPSLSFRGISSPPISAANSFSARRSSAAAAAFRRSMPGGPSAGSAMVVGFVPAGSAAGGVAAGGSSSSCGGGCYGGGVGGISSSTPGEVLAREGPSPVLLARHSAVGGGGSSITGGGVREGMTPLRGSLEDGQELLLGLGLGKLQSVCASPSGLSESGVQAGDSLDFEASLTETHPQQQQQRQEEESELTALQPRHHSFVPTLHSATAAAFIQASNTTPPATVPTSATDATAPSINPGSYPTRTPRLSLRPTEEDHEEFLRRLQSNRASWRERGRGGSMCVPQQGPAGSSGGGGGCGEGLQKQTHAALEQLRGELKSLSLRSMAAGAAASGSAAASGHSAANGGGGGGYHGNGNGACGGAGGAVGRLSEGQAQAPPSRLSLLHGSAGSGQQIGLGGGGGGIGAGGNSSGGLGGPLQQQSLPMRLC